MIILHCQTTVDPPLQMRHALPLTTQMWLHFSSKCHVSFHNCAALATGMGAAVISPLVGRAVWRAAALFSGPILPSFYVSLGKQCVGFCACVAEWCFFGHTTWDFAA